MKNCSFVIFAFMLASCEQYFVPDIEEKQRIFVFDGCITNNLDYPYVKISKSVSFNNDSALEYVPGFMVYVEDNKGFRIQLHQQSVGLYKAEQKIKGEIGKAYRLKATSTEGKTYSSQWETLQAGAPIDSIKGALKTKMILTYSEDMGYVEKETNGLEIYSNSNSEAFAPYYRYEYDLVHQKIRIKSRPGFSSATYMAIPASSHNKSFIATSNANIYANKSIQNNPVEFLEKELFFEKRTRVMTVGDDASADVMTYVTMNSYGVHIRLNQYSISEAGFKFWNAIKDQGNVSGQIFDAVNNQIYGNMYCEQDTNEIILGYFGASAITSEIIFMRWILPDVLVVKPIDYFPEITQVMTSNMAFEFWTL